MHCFYFRSGGLLEYTSHTAISTRTHGSPVPGESMKPRLQTQPIHRTPCPPNLPKTSHISPPVPCPWKSIIVVYQRRYVGTDSRNMATPHVPRDIPVSVNLALTVGPIITTKAPSSGKPMARKWRQAFSPPCVIAPCCM